MAAERRAGPLPLRVGPLRPGYRVIGRFADWFRPRWLAFAALSLSAAFLTLVVAVSIVALGLIEETDNGQDSEPDNVAATVPAATPRAAAGDNSVAVTLRDFTILLGAESADAGEITFNITNLGPDFVHEFVVIKTDLAPDALPLDADGIADEGAAGLQVYDAIEDIPVGETQRLTTDLEAGSYVVICNIFVEPEDGGRSHYAQGMRAAFTLE